MLRKLKDQFKTPFLDRCKRCSSSSPSAGSSTVPRDEACSEFGRREVIPSSALRWNWTMKQHVDSGRFEHALSVFAAMRNAGGAQPDHFTFPLVNRTISSLSDRLGDGEAVHCLGIRSGFCGDVYFCNTTIGMYARYGVVESARRVFDGMRLRDVVSWTSLMSGYVQVGLFREAFWLFREMRMDDLDLEPSPVTLAVILRACCEKKDAVGGRQLLGLAFKNGLDGIELVQNSILTVFSKAGCFKDAEEFFSRAVSKSVVTWNILMSGCSSLGNVSMVLHCYRKMKTESRPPNHETLTLVIAAITKTGDLRQGEVLHSHALKGGLIDSIMQIALMDFYAKCGEVPSSTLLFEEAKTKSSIAWSVMLWGFVQNMQFLEVIDLFSRMQESGLDPSKGTLEALTATYTYLGALKLGKGVHGYLIRNTFCGIAGVASLETSVLNMYAKCGSIVSARRCFDRMGVQDVVAWSSMIEAYGIHGLGLEALGLFYKMQEEGIRPNSVTLLNTLTACSHSGLVTQGCDVFDSMDSKFGIRPELCHYTCLVDLLGRCGKLHEALEVIKSMDVEPDSRIWGSLLASCRTYPDERFVNSAAQMLFHLEPDNVGYHVVFRNAVASGGLWDKSEGIWKLLDEKKLRKRPGWSCVEEKQRINLFVAGDRLHPRAREIYETLQILARGIQEFREF